MTHELKSKYGDRFEIYSRGKRPLDHGVMFVLPNARHLLLEDRHQHNECYKSALIVEEATNGFCNEFFNDDFDYWVSRLSKLDENSLKSMELYENKKVDICSQN